MKTSTECAKVFSAMAAVQSELEAAPKDSVNPHFKSRYADLATCVETARPILAKNKLAVLQFNLTDFEKGMVGISTVIAHESGEFLSGDIWCAPRTLNAQDVGAATTYLRRYGYSTMLGLTTEEDDDGNKASGVGQTSASFRPPATVAPRPQAPATKATVKPTTAASYNNNLVEHQDRIIEILKKGKIDEALWPDIGRKLNGRPFTDLRWATDAVLAEVSGKDDAFEIPFGEPPQ